MSTLTYTRASRTWLDRLPLGDGRLGAMVGADATSRRIGLNESSAWSGGMGSARRDLVDPTRAAAALAECRALLLADDPVAAEQALRPLQHRYAQAFLPVGELVVGALGGGSAACGMDETDVRELDLATGVHRARFAPATATTVVSAARGVVVHSEVFDDATDVEVTFSTSLRVREARWHETDVTLALDLPADVAPAHEPGEPALTWDLPGVRPLVAAVAIAVRHDGTSSPGGIGSREVSGSPEGALPSEGAVSPDDSVAGDHPEPGDATRSRGDRIVVHGARRVEVIVSIETTFAGAGREPGARAGATRRAVATVMAACEAGDLLEEHVRAFRAAAWPFSLELEGADRRHLDPDARIARVATRREPVVSADPGLLALLVEYGGYLLWCSSRAGGMPANLQGIWNESMQPPWSSAYTLNINTPMNYWGAEATGAADAHLALLGLLEALARRGTDTARRLYGARGWVAHHNTDVWGYTLPTRGDASWSHWALGGAWLVRQFDEHRRHGAMTPQTLARFWPVARDCARFLLDWMVELDGELCTLPSTSPENRYRIGDATASLTVSSAMDRALIGEVLALVVELAEEVGEIEGGDAMGRFGETARFDETARTAAAELVDEARAALRRIAPPRIGADGRIAEWGREGDGDHHDEDPQHRHLSHLYPWFPGNGIATGMVAEEPGDEASAAAGAGAEGDAQRLDAAAARTLDARGDDSTGWSLAWKIALRARLGDSVAVSRLLDLVARPAGLDDVRGDDPHCGGLYPNLFAAHPPFQIDGNLGLVGAFLEALVQSHRPGRIDLLPALPPGLSAGAVRGLVARPGIVIDLRWREGAPVHVRLRARSARAAGRIRLGHAGVHRDVDVPASGVLDLEWPAPAWHAGAVAPDRPPTSPNRSDT